MNPSGEYKGVQYDFGWNKDGWPASSMREYVNSTIYEALPEELRDNIKDTYVVSGHGYNDAPNKISTDKLYLLSTKEVWVKEGTSNPVINDTAEAETRQLDYYKSKGVTTSNYWGAIKNYNGSAFFWWLRSAYYDNTYTFSSVSSYGDWNDHDAFYADGVAVAFRL